MDPVTLSAGLGALGQIGGAALSSPPNVSAAKSQSGFGSLSSAFGDRVVIGGGSIEPTARITAFERTMPAISIGQPNDKTMLYLVAGGVLIWLLMSKK